MLITMAIAAVAIILVLGLAVDIGRMFITKNETQAFCDAAALAATLKLDGTTAGITKAQAAVAASTNAWNFGTTTIATPAITFATSVDGPWVSSPSPATGYIFTRVLATVPQQLYFMPIIVPQFTQNVASAATAGQIAITSFPRGLAPYTAVSTNTVGPNFGLTVGDSYDIQWPQYNSTRAGCGAGSPDKCFVSAACTGDSTASKVAVVTNWGANTSGYWGGNSNSIIEQEILDVIQLQALGIGTNIAPVLSNGTKASEAGYLDQRASQDINTSDNTVGGYMAAPHNGRRLLAMPIVDPVDPTQTTVIGYGLFLLMANGPGGTNYYARTTNGNDPFCALYAGSYNVGSNSPGTGGTTGASRVKLVQ
ncbi:MAG TPA: pilus assembly protein TadG-related protein [Bryobacteraceae bacterium]|nr:pilus assembly protein TadG-related protein [Bryobacteraceae bacterium]